MALSATAVFEVRTTGSDTNGGFYVSGGTDYSQSDTPVLSLTDVVTNGTTTVTSATGGFASAHIGNGINIAGTIYQITARTDTNTITIDRTAAAATGQVGNVGGALASPGKAGASVAAGNRVWVKTGTYSITSTTANVSGGRVATLANPGSDDLANVWEGYATTRGDLGTKPIWKASGISSTTLLTVSHIRHRFDNIEIDGSSLTSITGVSMTAESQVVRLWAHHCPATGISSSTGHLTLCRASNNGTGITLQSNAFACVAHNNTGAGFLANGGIPCLSYCLSYANGTYGFHTTRPLVRYANCTARGNTSHGFYWEGTGIWGAAPLSLLSHGNGGYGFRAQNTQGSLLLLNCAGGSNTSGNYDASNLPAVSGFVALSVDPFTNAAGGDFSVNNTAGGGALLRGAGVPGAFPGGLTTGYPDIGAVQHQSSGGGFAPFGSGLIGAMKI